MWKKLPAYFKFSCLFCDTLGKQYANSKLLMGFPLFPQALSAKGLREDAQK